MGYGIDRVRAIQFIEPLTTTTRTCTYSGARISPFPFLFVGGEQDASLLFLIDRLVSYAFKPLVRTASGARIECFVFFLWKQSVEQDTT